MYCLNKFCILCTSDIKLKLLHEIDKKTIFYITILLPELENITNNYPIYICANCENIVNIYNNLKKNSLVNYKKWKEYINILQENCNAERGEVEIRIYKSGKPADPEEINDVNLYIDSSDSDISIINIACSESYESDNNDLERQTNIVEDCDDSSEDEFMSSLTKKSTEENTEDEGKFRCHCGKTFCSDESLEKHKILHNGKFKCSLCKCQYARMFRLKLHYRTKHPKVKIPKYSSWKYECMSCPMKYTSYYLYEDHIKNTCNNKSYITKDGLKYICSRCEKTFVTEAKLKFHLIQEHNFGLFHCPICKKRFLTIRGLTLHKNQHGIIKNHCKPCNITFNTKVQFNKHNLKHHESNLDNRCPFCDEIYSSVDSLYQHMEVHNESKT